MPEAHLSTEHLGEAISALLDGELDAREEADARRHLDGCEDCRNELAATASVARTVQGLPPVEPPFGFYERMLRGGGFAADHSRRVRIGMAVATAAAVVALVVGIAANFNGTAVSPPVDDMVDVHQAGFLPSTGFDPLPADEMETTGVPSRLSGGYQRQLAYERPADHMMAVTYRSGTDTLSVFEQDGHLETDSVDGLDALPDHMWAMGAGELHAVVVARDGVVYTMVTDAPMEAVTAMAHDLPDAPSPSLVQRARDACTEVAWTFGLGS